MPTAIYIMSPKFPTLTESPIVNRLTKGKKDYRSYDCIMDAQEDLGDISEQVDYKDERGVK